MCSPDCSVLYHPESERFLVPFDEIIKEGMVGSGLSVQRTLSDRFTYYPEFFRYWSPMQNTSEWRTLLLDLVKAQVNPQCYSRSVSGEE